MSMEKRTLQTDETGECPSLGGRHVEPPEDRGVSFSPLVRYKQLGIFLPSML